jgi:glycosyltransferase involved in cell wall biosynthesis
MFSIIACTNNSNTNWTESIDSIINQKYDNWELLIVFYDTEITEHITNLMKKYNSFDETSEESVDNNQPKKIKVLHYSDEKSYGSVLLRVANNESLYNYISIMELGDIWAPIKLEKQSKTLIEYPKIDVLGGKSIYTGVINNK